MPQIDILSIKIPEWVKWSGWVAFAVLILFLKSCEGKTIQTATVVVPEIKGKFESKKPDHTQIAKDDVVKKGDNVYIENPINEKLLTENELLQKDFFEADSLNKVLMYEKAIQLNAFSSDFDDEFLKLNVSGVVRGEVQEITPSYTIKERKVTTEIKCKETVFRLLGGAEIGNNLQFNDFTVKGNLMFQNKSGGIFSASYDTNKTIYVGYNFSLIDLKH